jgi:hypothetical protein
VVTGGLLASTQLLACSVCWGSAQDPVIQGTKLSIVFLLGLTYLLLGGGIGMVFMARRRALRSHRAALDGAEAAAAGGIDSLAPSASASRD